MSRTFLLLLAILGEVAMAVPIMRIESKQKSTVLVSNLDSSMERKSSTRRRRTNIEFGGTKHEVDQYGDLRRPEMVKSLQCASLDSSSCAPCSELSQCWHGINADVVVSGHTYAGAGGHLEINVPASSEASSSSGSSRTCTTQQNSWCTNYQNAKSYSESSQSACLEACRSDSSCTAGYYWGASGKKCYLFGVQGSQASSCTSPSSHGDTDRFTCSDSQSLIAETSQVSYHYYMTEVYVKCATDSGKMFVNVENLQGTGAKIFVYRDQTKLLEVTSTGSNQVLTGNMHGIIRVYLRHTAGQSASAEIEILADSVDHDVDDCMGVKECLNVFGDASAAGFRVRNDNRLQRKCVKNQLAGLSSADVSKCNAWKTCLDNAGLFQGHSIMNTLKDVLDVSLGASLLEEGATAHSVATDDPGCVNPAVDDIQGLQCNCYEKALNSCPGSGQECLKTYMCNHNYICPSWKSSNCPGLLLQQNESKQDKGKASLTALEARQKSSGHSLEDTLDQTTMGKTQAC